MFNFAKLAKAKAASAPSGLVDLFNQLDRKATHESLRPVQIEALTAIEEQLGQRDVVLKVSTGAGKTVIGLVYAEYMRRKYPGEPVLYLCPTRQLVEQVVQAGSTIGVHVDAFPDNGHPHAALEGKSVLACTYDRLFNSKNTFARNNYIPSAIIFDDVHSGTDRIKGTYTVPITGEAYKQIRGIFAPLCSDSDPAIWRGIGNDEADSVFEVPFWIWASQSSNVASILDDHKEDEALRFVWENVERYVDDARLCISGISAELSLLVPATEENLAYSSSKHRLFMSASIKDGASLIRDLDCDEASLGRTVEPVNDRGAGERMVLPVGLIDPTLTKEEIANLCAHVAKRANVVILTSSLKQADIWAGHGAVSKHGKSVENAVAELRFQTKGGFVVFPQRFDGVDLPDDACRVLVVDGIPVGERLCDIIDGMRQKNSPGQNVRVVNRFEQALGRAVRSSADFAAILLVGQDLAAFIGRRDVKQLLESHTQEQIELGKSLAEQIVESGANPIDAIRNAIDVLLDREEGWKEAHRERMSSLQRQTRGGSPLRANERAALAERQAWKQAKSRNHQSAAALLQKAVDDRELHPIQRAELMFRMAGYMNHFDPGQAATLYRGAFQLNSALPRPVQMPDRRYARIKEQTVNLRDHLQQFVNANAAIARLEEIRAKLAFSGDAETVEQGLFELGEMLGAESARPEKETGRGPDVLWVFDDVALCIEAKSEKTAPIFKSDAEQLLMSIQWCQDNAGLVRDSVVPVFATNSLAADRPEDVSFGPMFMTEQIVIGVVERLRGLINGVSYDGPLFNDVVQIHQRISAAKLRGDDLKNEVIKYRQ